MAMADEAKQETIQLTDEEKQEIKTIADEHFEGGLKLGAAAHVHSVGIIKKCANQILDWHDRKAIDDVYAQLQPAEETPPQE